MSSPTHTYSAAIIWTFLTTIHILHEISDNVCTRYSNRNQTTTAAILQFRTNDYSFRSNQAKLWLWFHMMYSGHQSRYSAKSHTKYTPYKLVATQTWHFSVSFIEDFCRTLQIMTGQSQKLWSNENFQSVKAQSCARKTAYPFHKIHINNSNQIGMNIWSSNLGTSTD